MNDFNSEDDEPEADRFQVDIYGVRLSGNAKPTHDHSQEVTLREVMNDVCQSLLRILRDSIGFVADVFTGGRSIIRGVASLPAAIASRISGAHDEAEKREAHADRQVVPSLENQREAIERLEAILIRHRESGKAVSVGTLPNGTPVIGLVAVGNENIVLEAAESASEQRTPPKRTISEVDPSEIIRIEVK